MKWYYIAIPVGLILAYVVLSPKSTLLHGSGSGSNSGWGGILSGFGNAATGAGKLWTSIFPPDSTSSSGEE